MNLLCPNCQKMLTVPDQSAGQTMRCPLCTGTFTVPSLAPPPLSAAPAPLPASSSPAAASPPAEDIFGVAPPPSVSAPPKVDEPARSPLTLDPAPATQSPPPSPPAGETGFTLTIHPQVVPWLAPAALAVAFLLLFLPWVGALVPGEKLEWYTQSGWGNAFGNGLGILYILFYLVALPLSAAVVALPILGVKLPPQLDPVWPWRSVIVTGLIGAATFFLIVQLATGTGLESRLGAIAKNPEQFKDDDLAKKLKSEQERQYAQATIYHSTWLRLGLVCHLIALGGLGLQYWLQQRGDKPLPHVDIIW